MIREFVSKLPSILNLVVMLSPVMSIVDLKLQQTYAM
jgi:hypothetical protein